MIKLPEHYFISYELHDYKSMHVFPSDVHRILTY